jgi:hypothetical protein
MTRKEFLAALALPPETDFTVTRFVPYSKEELKNDYWFREYGIIRGKQDFTFYDAVTGGITHEVCQDLGRMYLNSFMGILNLEEEAHECSCKPNEVSAYVRAGVRNGKPVVVTTVHVYREIVHV